MTDHKAITAEAIEFIENVSYNDLPAEALRVGKRCMVDSLGVMIAGCSEHSVHILIEDALDQGGKAEALLLSGGQHKAPAAIAARVLGTAGHAHDWDDTQVSHDPAHVYGLLTHQSMYAMLKLVLDNDLKPEEVEAIRFYAGKNILEPIRYPVAINHLQAKFSMPALLAMMVLKRRASHHEFLDDFVSGPAMQDMQKRTQCLGDPQIDAQGYDLIRSRIEVDTKDGRTLVQWADERYRGGPLNPISDSDLEDKFRMCAEGALSDGQQARLLSIVAGLEDVADSADLAKAMVFEKLRH